MESSINQNEQLNKGDPSKWDYQRVLVRPDLHFFAVLSRCLFVLSASGLIFCLSFYGGNLTLRASVGMTTLFCFVCFLFCAKQVAIWIVKLYQRYAPIKIRLKCRFEPSCSEYMILSIEKYGFLRGIFRGVKRICRCRPGNGGFDLP